MWVMMYCFRRCHYRKSLLIWLFLVKYWEGNAFCKDIFNLFKNHLNVIDESVVEYVHSVIRRHTTDGASEKTLADTMGHVKRISVQHSLQNVIMFSVEFN
jgi:hypothetical protein